MLQLPAKMKEFNSVRMKIAELALAGAGLATVACGGSGTTKDPIPKNRDQNSLSNSQNLEKLQGSVDLGFPWVDNDPWYFTSGPHFDGLSRGIKYSLDFAPPLRVDCPGNPPITNRYVTSAAKGVVIVKGDESNLNDPNHSVVEIRHGDGSITGYMHLANIRVNKGDSINAGVALGNPSCEVTPGGETTGQHVHFYLKDANGNPIPIKEKRINGWLVVEDATNRNGLLEKTGESTRTADTRRCGPSASSIRVCGGIRNDLGGDSSFDPPTPIRPTATFTPTPLRPSPGPKPEPTTPTPTVRPEPVTPRPEPVLLSAFEREVFNGLNEARVVKPVMQLSPVLEGVAQKCRDLMLTVGFGQLGSKEIRSLCALEQLIQKSGYKSDFDLMGLKNFSLVVPQPRHNVANVYIEGAPNQEPLNTAKYQWMGIACLPIREFPFVATDGRRFTAYDFGCVMVFGTTQN